MAAKQKTCSKCGAARDGKKCTKCGHLELRGGSREDAGRTANEPDEKATEVQRGFATRVLLRIRELKLQYRVDIDEPDLESEDVKKREAAEKRKAAKLAAAPAIKDAEDYALDILRPRDVAARELFKLMLAYQLGKPVQPVMSGDTRELVPEVEFDGLIMPNRAGTGKTQPAKAGKPN